MKPIPNAVSYHIVVERNIKYPYAGKGIEMKRSAMALILVAIFMASSAHAIEATGTFMEAKATAAANNKPLLVDFFTTW